MPARWLRWGLWRPYELACRRLPLLPFRATVTEEVAGVRAVRIENALTRLLGRIGGGYRYAACYLVGDELLVDTGYPWAGRALRDTLRDLGVAGTLTTS